MLRRIISVATLAVIANFGFQPLAIPMSAMGADASPYDGVYKPTSSSAMPIAPRAHCNVPMSTMYIKNGVVNMKWREQITGPVNADGNISLGEATSKLEGKIRDGVFEGKVTGAMCMFMVTLTKS